MLDPTQVFINPPAPNVIRQWRVLCKVCLLEAQEWQCAQCGTELVDEVGAECHEAIVTRGDLRGPNQWYAYNGVNMAVICHACHQNPECREWYRERAENLYGASVVDDFLRSLPWKVKPIKQGHVPRGGW